MSTVRRLMSRSRTRCHACKSLDRQEAHILPANRFGNRLGIDVVVLVRLDERFDELARNQPYLVALRARRLAQKARSAAGFHADGSLREIRRIGQQLLAGEFLA